MTEDADNPSEDIDPDVYLDVPVVLVDEINLDVRDLRAKVSLQAEVLDLLKLSVGADVFLGSVNLTIKGVEAQALLKVRLDNVARIIDRVLRTIDDNPQILEHLTRNLGTAVRDLGSGAGYAVRDVGAGAGHAVRDVGAGAGHAVHDVGTGAGAAVRDVGAGTGGAVRDVGAGAGEVVQDVGTTAGGVVEDATGAVEDVGTSTVRDVSAEAAQAAEQDKPQHRHHRYHFKRHRKGK
ncbi:thioesterase [Nonomuraea rubra]|uniref:thioesterase n=1 Tax=Nonomuraea rubra TaxID=46180 RepID=UPI0033F7B7DB